MEPHIWSYSERQDVHHCYHLSSRSQLPQELRSPPTVELLSSLRDNSSESKSSVIHHLWSWSVRKDHHWYLDDSLSCVYPRRIQGTLPCRGHHSPTLLVTIEVIRSLCTTPLGSHGCLQLRRKRIFFPTRCPLKQEWVCDSIRHPVSREKVIVHHL